MHLTGTTEQNSITQHQAPEMALCILIKKLAKEILSTSDIQQNHHDSVSLHDIVIVMILFSLFDSL